MLRSFEETHPQVAESAYVDETAVVIGDVVVNPEASIWPNVTLRGDSGQIVVGEAANVQDNAVLHEDGTLETEATVGHGAIVHGATVGERALVGMNATVLSDAHLGAESVAAAGSVVTEGTNVEPGTLVAGTPATSKGEIESSEFGSAGAHYVDLARRHRETASRIE